MKKPEISSLAPLLKWLEKVPSSQRFWVLTGMVSLAAGFAAVQFIHQPAAAKQKASLSKLQEEEKRLETVSGIASRQKELERLSKKVLHEGGAEAMIPQVAHMAAQTGLTLLSAAPKSSSSVGPYEQIQIEIKTKGSFESLRSFLTNVEKQEPYIEVVRLEMKGDVPPPAGGGPFPWPESAENLSAFEERMGDRPKPSSFSFLSAPMEIRSEITLEGWTKKAGAEK